MQSTLKNRLEALERRAPSEDNIDTIIISFVRPGASGPERWPPVAMRTYDRDWRLERDPGEGVDAFHERATRLCPRNGGGAAMLLELFE